MGKGRSPNCPTMTLADALDRGRKVYGKEHTHPATREVIAQDLGYSGISGASASVVGALRQYGILEGRGEDLHISDDAVAVFELPEDSPERTEALTRLAFNPPLFEELHRQFGDRLPGDGNLRHLLVKKGFLSETADDVIRTYRDNLTVASSVENGDDKDNEFESTEDEMTPASEPKNPLGGRIPPLPPPPPSNRTPVGSEIPVAKDCIMGVNASGRVTQEGIDKLIQYLGLIKGSFPADADLN